MHLEPYCLVRSSELLPTYSGFIALKVSLLVAQSTATIWYKSEIIPTSSLISGTRSLLYGVLWRSSCCFEQFDLSCTSLWFCYLGIALVLVRSFSIYVARALCCFLFLNLQPMCGQLSSIVSPCQSCPFTFPKGFG